VHVGFLDHRGERLLGRAPRLQEGGEVAALAQLGDLTLDPARACVPGAPPIAVALLLTRRVTQAVSRSGAGFHRGFHQPLGGKGQHLAHQVGVGVLFDQFDQRHSLVGHRRLRSSGSSRQLEP
jgi:hypothetical protein